MNFDDTMLYEQFVAARRKAVELTDAYREASVDDPRRVVLWENVVRQTEVARGLLETWLTSGHEFPRVPTAHTLSAGR